MKIPFSFPDLKSFKIKKPKIDVGLAQGTFLGIDVGTSSLKVVELNRSGDRIKLENYGEMQAFDFYKNPFRSFEKNTLLLAGEDVAKAIKGIAQEAKIKTTEAVFSIPDFSTFFTSFTLPPMSQDEIPQAVEYEARQHVPLPLSDITLDWQLIGGRTLDEHQSGTKLNILLVAVPNEVVNQYQQIAEQAGLDLRAIEAEVFSLARAVTAFEQKPVVVVDIGAQSTTVSVVDKNTVKLSHSFDMGGSEFTQRLSQAMEMEHEEAEKLKRKQGIEHSVISDEFSVPNQGALASTPTPRAILTPLIDLVVSEIEKISRTFKRNEGKDIDKIFLAGGSVLLPGLKEYIGSQVKEEVLITNPFSDLFYPPIMERLLKDMGPSWAVAVGAALRGLE